MFVKIDQYGAGFGVHGNVEASVPHNDPRLSHLASGSWVLRQELHDWLVERGIDYRLYWHRSQDGTPVGGNFWEVELPDCHDESFVFRLKYGF